MVDIKKTKERFIKVIAYLETGRIAIESHKGHKDPTLLSLYTLFGTYKSDLKDAIEIIEQLESKQNV